MKITSIKQQVKNENRVSIFVDGKYTFSLNIDQLLEEKLKSGLELDEARVKSLKKLSDEGKVRARTLEWALNRPHSEKELREYMYRKKIDKDFSENIIEEFKEKNYINDSKFARWFAENRLQKNKSSREIISELKSKGISYETMQSIVTDLELIDKDNDSLKAIVNKLREKPRYSDEHVLIRYLLNKGFNYAEIKDALNS